MVTSAMNYLPYRELFRRQSIHALRESEVPTEHAVSFGLPTRRWVGPAYAFFASPAIRRPGEPVEQRAPDRWWVLDARTGHVVIYALTAAIPIAEGAQWGTVTLPSVNRGMEEIRASHARLAELIDRAAPPFFANEPGDPTARSELAEALRAAIPVPLQPQYRALVPDFVAWLEH